MSEDRVQGPVLSDEVLEVGPVGPVTTASKGSETVLGQAGEAVVVERPAPGQTVEIQAAAGQTYVLNFSPQQAQVLVQDGHFILAFDDDGDGIGDSRVVFLDMVSQVESGDAPAFEVAGVEIDTGLLLSQAMAMAGQYDQPPYDEVAGGPNAAGGGASVYNDNLGDVLDLLAAQGVIPPVALQFGVPDPEDDIVLVGSEAAPELPPGTPEPEPDPILIVGENVNDVADETTPHRVHTPSSEQDEGPLFGGDGADVLIGDVGGAVADGQTMNLVLVLDTSDSMEAEITFNGAAMRRIEALDLATERLLDKLAGTEGATVRVHLVSFASVVKEVGTFDIITDGVVDAAALQAAKDFILGAGDNPTAVAEGDTNYEAGLGAALDWFTDDANTLDDPDFNQTVFISDGLPNRAYRGDGTDRVTGLTSAQDALDQALGQVDVSDDADDDTVSEVDGLLGSFEGVPARLGAVGINVGADGVDILDQVDGADASNIQTGEELLAVLDDLTAPTQLAAVGGDLIVGADGDDLLFGDAIFTDALAAAEGVGLPAGSGWSVIEALAGDGFFDADPARTLEQEIMDFLRDPASHAAYDLGRESLGAGGGRAGGSDSLDGGGGDDLIFGQEGDDTLTGGTGDDTLSGGSGSDTFRWGSETSAGEADIIADFESGAGGDVLDLSALLSGVAAGDGGNVLDAYLNVSSDGTNTTIGIDANGDGSGFTDATITVQSADLTGGSAVQADIIDDLLAAGNLQVA